MEMGKNILGLQHVGLPTNNIEATIQFYESLGFDVVYRTFNRDLGCNEEVAFLRLNGVTIETFENHQAVLTNGAIDHIALNVSDIEAVFDFACKVGYELVNKEILFLPFWDKGVRFFTILGPNKEKVEFSQYL